MVTSLYFTLATCYSSISSYFNPSGTKEFDTYTKHQGGGGSKRVGKQYLMEGTSKNKAKTGKCSIFNGSEE